MLTLPAEYVATHVELGYAATINRVQGMTVDTSHILVDPQSTSREQLYVAATRGRESNRMYAVVEETLEVDAHAPDHLRTSILDALTAVLAREGAERSATEEIQREQDAAASLSTLLPDYEDALARVYDPDQIGRMEAVIRDVLDAGIADRVINNEAWTHLASRLAAHEARGADVRAQLAAAVRTEDTGTDSTVESVAKIYHHRIGAPVATTDDSALPTWVAPPPAGTAGDNREVRDWLHTQADLIQDRTAALVDAAVAALKPWSATLRPQPDDASLRRGWRRDLGNVLAFRDLNQVTDAESPLGAVRPDDDAYAAAAVSLERISTCEDSVGVGARRRVSALRQRLADNPSPAVGAVDVAERVRRLVVAFRDLNQVTDTESPLGAARTDDDAYTAAAASLERLRVVDSTAAAEARRRVAGLRNRLSGDTGIGGAVDVAERVRRLGGRDLEQEQPASDDVPIRRTPGHRPTV